MSANPKSLSDFLEEINRLGALWRTPRLSDGLQIVFSPRLRRSFGRCYPRRRVIRLADPLSGAARENLDEALAHEAAHLAVFRRHGRAAQPHGKEWRELMEKAGFDPNSKLRLPCGGSISTGPAKQARTTTWVHRCPVCHMTRTARRPMRAWRCRACSASGIDGRLDITSRPPASRPAHAGRDDRAVRAIRAPRTARRARATTR